MLNVNGLFQQYLSEAEGLFGLMVPSWRFGGVEFDDQPPHLRYFPDCSQVKIFLSNRALNDGLQLKFQLAHEICHLLYPSLNLETLEMEPSTVLNEGISTFFSVTVLSESESDIVVENMRQYNHSYYEALTHVTQLLKIDIHSVKKLRGHEPFINRINVNHFHRAGINVPEKLKLQLTSRF